MPHSVSPGSAHDADMPDAPSAPAESSTENVKLEEMFDDDDDEFPAGDVKMESPAATQEE